MKVYLDDERAAPEGWVLVKTAEDAILMLMKHPQITHLSLDHDLGTELTGYDVLLWIELQVHEAGLSKVPELSVHSANSGARPKMELAVEAINKKVKSMSTKWTVTIIESERGWGQRVDEVKEFGDYDAARKFVDEFNAENDKDEVPDWYMYAQEPVAQKS